MHFFALEQNLPGSWEVKPGENPYECGFSAAGRTDYGYEFTPVSVKAQLAQGSNFSLRGLEGFAQALCPEFHRSVPEVRGSVSRPPGLAPDKRVVGPSSS